MLKIKDSVDLEELKKFGFEPKYRTEVIYDEDGIATRNDFLSYYQLGGVYDDEFPFMGTTFSSRWSIIIYVSNRRLSISSMLLGVEETVYKYLYEGIIFDLIQAGLVEKVEQNEQH